MLRKNEYKDELSYVIENGLYGGESYDIELRSIFNDIWVFSRTVSKNNTPKTLSELDEEYMRPLVEKYLNTTKRDISKYSKSLIIEVVIESIPLMNNEIEKDSNLINECYKMIGKSPINESISLKDLRSKNNK